MEMLPAFFDCNLLTQDKKMFISLLLVDLRQYID